MSAKSNCANKIILIVFVQFWSICAMLYIYIIYKNCRAFFAFALYNWNKIETNSEQLAWLFVMFNINVNIFTATFGNHNKCNALNSSLRRWFALKILLFVVKLTWLLSSNKALLFWNAVVTCNTASALAKKNRYFSTQVNCLDVHAHKIPFYNTPKLIPHLKIKNFLSEI